VPVLVVSALVLALAIGWYVRSGGPAGAGAEPVRGAPATRPSPAPAPATPSPPPATPPPAATPGGGGPQVLRLPSPGSGRPRAVWVYRPPGVPDSARLPVLYLLHGYPGNPGAFYQSLAIGSMMTGFTRAGGPPFVVVLPEGDGDTHSDSEWADSVDGTDRIETFVTSVVIPAVEGRNRRDATDRAIAGFSMGGYGAMNLALRHRDLFGQVASLAGYFSIDDPDGVFAGRPAVIAANSPDRNLRDAVGLRILLSDGTADDQAVTQGQTQRFARQLAAAGLPATTELVPGGQHDSAYVRAELPAVAAFLAAGWPPAR
jgi:S-formylglutathione hydrolase FrmB